jgi:hypothetical protein
VKGGWTRGEETKEGKKGGGYLRRKGRNERQEEKVTRQSSWRRNEVLANIEGRMTNILER